jgi:hypothetical protein
MSCATRATYLTPRSQLYKALASIVEIRTQLSLNASFVARFRVKLGMEG